MTLLRNLIMLLGNFRRAVSKIEQELNPDTVLQTCNINIKIADLGNACWMVSDILHKCSYAFITLREFVSKGLELFWTI